MVLFTEEINGWESWGQVYQSLEAFRPLILEIYRRHGLPAPTPEHLTPGTNAVFRCGDMVVKIFAPAESGIVPDTAELEGLRHAGKHGVPAPLLLARGELADRYVFPYLIMEYVEGREAGEVLPCMADDEKMRFARKVRVITDKLHHPAEPGQFADTVAENVRISRRWKPFPAGLYRDALDLAGRLDPATFVYVHGDLTGENVLIDQEGNPRLIDFGDSHIAPREYEWMPLVFGLFHCDPVLLEAYFGDYRNEAFFRTLADSLLLHDFGGDSLRELCEEAAVPLTELEDREALFRFLRDIIR